MVLGLVGGGSPPASMDLFLETFLGGWGLLKVALVGRGAADSTTSVGA
jgi:hypothetical protein